MKSEIAIRISIRRWVTFFIVALVLSGLTAFALETELAWLVRLFSGKQNGMSLWINKVYQALKETNRRYPFLAYGYDWLAFAHLTIAVAFYGVLDDPLKNKWIITFGRIACIMIFPLAFIAGYARGIPFIWQLIDCSFGVIGLIPLTIVDHKIKELENICAIRGSA
ncbi:MAG TPA: hypothetical protein VG890_16005 [Puia sp.]|nr:hypothetical protein [Puia sp.]